MVEKAPLKVLYVVNINAPTSVPLETAGKIAELSRRYNILFNTAAYYKQNDEHLRTNFAEDLIELNFSKSYDLKNIKCYYKLIRKINPHIIHLHHGVSAFQGAILAKLAGVKLVFKTEHNDHKFYKWYQKILTIPIFMFADKIICNSKSTQLSYYPWEKLLASNKSTFAYNGINITEIEKASSAENRKALRMQYHINSDEKLFVSVGRLIPQKNYQRLIIAMINICKQNKKFKLIIVGGGKEEDQLKKIIEEDKMDQNIFITGTIQREDVYRYIHACDFFIISSLWEGFCNSLVEAMAAGKPILCSDISTLSEVADNVPIAFFRADSIHSIEEAIKKAASLTDKEIEHFAARAKKRAFDNFTIERTAERYIMEYKKVMQIHD
jgi:glycosyltransferase involved in cell wall biosynthesis